jgi:hypothetical protein
VFHTKEMMKRLIEEKKHIILYVDLHGHSKKANVFMYGCEDATAKYQEQVFPRLLSQNRYLLLLIELFLIIITMVP